MASGVDNSSRQHNSKNKNTTRATKFVRNAGTTDNVLVALVVFLFLFWLKKIHGRHFPSQQQQIKTVTLNKIEHFIFNRGRRYLLNRPSFQTTLRRNSSCFIIALSRFIIALPQFIIALSVKYGNYCTLQTIEIWFIIR